MGMPANNEHYLDVLWKGVGGEGIHIAVLGHLAVHEHISIGTG